MPFKSKAQHRKFRAMEAAGEIPTGTSSRWAHHTPGGLKGLPEKKRKDRKSKALKGKKKAAQAAPPRAANLLDTLEATFKAASARSGESDVSSPNLHEGAVWSLLDGPQCPLVAAQGRLKAASGPLTLRPSGGGAGSQPVPLPDSGLERRSFSIGAEPLSGLAAMGYVKEAMGQVLQTGTPIPQSHVPANPQPDPTSPTEGNEEYWRQQMVAMLGGGVPPPMMGIQLDGQDVDGTAETLGSPIGTGPMGNGPGVGMSGAGTQMNWGGMGFPKAGSSRKEVAAELLKAADGFLGQTKVGEVPAKFYRQHGDRTVIGSPAAKWLPSFFPKSDGKSVEFRTHGDVVKRHGDDYYEMLTDSGQGVLGNITGSPWSAKHEHGIYQPLPRSRRAGRGDSWLLPSGTREVYSYACNPGNPSCGLAANPSTYEDMLGTELERVTMQPAGSIGLPTSGLTNLPYHALNAIGEAGAVEPLHTYVKGDDGEWQDTGVYQPALDRFVSKYRWPLGLGAAAAAGLGGYGLYRWLRGGKDEEEEAKR